MGTWVMAWMAWVSNFELLGFWVGSTRSYSAVFPYGKPQIDQNLRKFSGFFPSSGFKVSGFEVSTVLGFKVLGN
jgi:hypothetical protein